MENQMNRIKEIFCEIVGVDESEVDDNTSYQSLEPWDSLKHLAIVSRLEEEFDIDIEMDDIIAMETFKKIKELVGKYLDKEGD